MMQWVVGKNAAARCGAGSGAAVGVVARQCRSGAAVPVVTRWIGDAAGDGERCRRWGAVRGNGVMRKSASAEVRCAADR